MSSELVVQLSLAEPAERVAIAEAYARRATQYATPKALASSDHLSQVRTALLSLAEQHGFPDGSAAPSFDAALPELLVGTLRMSPAEAGVVEVWNYLTLVLVPDLALWRWPNSHVDPAYERLVGKPRNFLRRHWWRGHLLGPSLTADLREDEAVQIVERSASLGSDPRVARAVGTAFVRFVETHRKESHGQQSGLKRMELMRDTAKRLLRIGRVVVLSVLTNEELDGLSHELLVNAATAQLGPGESLVEVAAADHEPPEEFGVDLASAVPSGPERLLNQELSRICERAEAEVGVAAGALRRRLADYGGLEAANMILLEPPSSWLLELLRLGRPDLTVEFVVMKPEFRGLFSDQLVFRAAGRLFDEGEDRAD